MFSALNPRIKEIVQFLFLFLLSSFFYFYKLDNSYFFTDEILYLDSGRQYLKGNFENNMQVPFVGQFILGIGYRLFDHNVFWLRMPFAIMGILSCILIFYLLRKEFDTKLALIGFGLFLFNQSILDATKMGMLEAPMHLFWLLTAYFFLEANKKQRYLYFSLAGLFLGLSLASKFMASAIIPAIFVYFILNFKKNKEYLLGYLSLFFASFLGFLVTYYPAINKLGLKTAYNRVSTAFVEVYLGKSESGKQHLVNGEVYLKSPWWSYFYFLYNKLSIFGFILYLGGVLSSLTHIKNKFLYFWLTFFISTLTLFQFSGVKNERYLSSILVPSVILIVIGINFLLKKFKSAKYIVYFLIFTQIFNTSYKLITQEPDRYNGLINNFVASETTGFSQNKKSILFH
jgi:4-amino-4-deoxy-L-arabinose transferase-like glycosyltransferase